MKTLNKLIRSPWLAFGLMAFAILIVTPAHAQSTGLDISMNSAQSTSNEVTGFTRVILNTVMFVSLGLGALLAVMAILELINKGEWSQVRNKLAGFVALFALSGAMRWLTTIGV